MNSGTRTCRLGNLRRNVSVNQSIKQAFLSRTCFWRPRVRMDRREQHTTLRTQPLSMASLSNTVQKARTFAGAFDPDVAAGGALVAQRRVVVQRALRRRPVVLESCRRNAT